MPVRRVGMASGTADLQRDLGGAIMQSIFGALLTAGYVAAAGAALAASGKSVTSSVQEELTKSFSSSVDAAKQYPQYVEPDHRGRQEVIPPRTALGLCRRADRGGDREALVFFMFPKHERERRLIARYEAESNPDPGARAGTRSVEQAPA